MQRERFPYLQLLLLGAQAVGHGCAAPDLDLKAAHLQHANTSEHGLRL